MTGQKTPNELVLDLLQYGRDLEKVTDELAVLDPAVVPAHKALIVAKETALLNCPKEYTNQLQRDAHAKLASIEEWAVAELADSKVRVVRARIACLKSQIDIGRSAAAALREEMRTI